VVTINDIEYQAHAGDEFEIPAGATHRLAGGEEGIVVLELALGEFDESDIERVADDFGRTSPPAA
jgi:quercetin dioxygenase-like cupin family protein